ncbi:patatin-like phospholipase family protein [Amphibiibacter pelophylacis]|uniref:Patatin-like phospholipase family protein n=1 Tax=Amphibiibacter pelophylacis TaxID=1799477 RepID=A0ACC6P0Y0_9BURK
MSASARPPPGSAHCALVLSGGGARTAYQAGVLAALAAVWPHGHFPFLSLFGTSAGAINAAFLASRASRGVSSLAALARYWRRLTGDTIYRLPVPHWATWHRWLLAWQLSQRVQRTGALLDNTPLQHFLRQGIDWADLARATREGPLDALGITASSYTGGEHWTFCQLRPGHALPQWQRPGRRLHASDIRLEHVMASSAIPFLFPGVALDVPMAPGSSEPCRELFGDGAMRHTFPLSAPMHLGARRILVISANPGPQPDDDVACSTEDHPSLAHIAGHVLNSVFHDTLHSNMDQIRRINSLIGSLPPEATRTLDHGIVDVMAIHPSRGPDEIAREHMGQLPPGLRDALDSLGMLADSSGVLASYLLFSPGFIAALIRLGWDDGLARRDELVEFLSQASSAPKATRPCAPRWQ